MKKKSTILLLSSLLAPTFLTACDEGSNNVESVTFTLTLKENEFVEVNDLPK